MRPDERIARIAERQFGVFSLFQARRAGFSQDQVDYRVRTGRWIRLHRGVYLMNGVALSIEARICAATLASKNAYPSHIVAGHLFDITRQDVKQRIDVTVTRRTGVALPGIRIHRPVAIARSDLSRVGRIPVTSPARTVLDLAGVLDPPALEEALDEALRRRLVQVAALVSRIDTWRTTGATVLRPLLLDRQMRRTESPLEARFLRLVRAARLPAPEPQYRVRLSGRVVARVDFAFVDERVAVELDGYAYHGHKRAYDARHERDRLLFDAGWLPLHFTDHQVTNAADALVTTLRRELVRRARTG